MRIGVIVILAGILAATPLRADETLPYLKVGSDIYSNVTVTAVTPTDIYFTSDKGMANAKLKDLDPALQKHFNYDAGRAAATESKQKAASFQTPFPAPGLVIDQKNAQSVMDEAIARVKAIVNQPVVQIPKDTLGEFEYANYPFWFHPGALTPDFNNVDIRTAQETQYKTSQYIESDMDPGVVFLGTNLEFNKWTKYFYVDRSLPKKKLTEDEMVEINRLYRIIGKCQTALNAAEDSAVTQRSQSDLSSDSQADSQPASQSNSQLASIHLFIRAHKQLMIAVIGVGVLYLLFARLRAKGQA